VQNEEKTYGEREKKRGRKERGMEKGEEILTYKNGMVSFFLVAVTISLAD
jgi:hypothetical protein